MSAKRDFTQKISFYYGDAARDLAHLLPKDDFVKSAALESLELSKQVQELVGVMDRVQHALGKVNETRRRLSFLIKDLRRSIT